MTRLSLLSLLCLSFLGFACGSLPAKELAEAPAKVEDMDAYVPDPDPVVRQRIEEWRDLKFGLLMHWGAYSQLGIVESWSICPEDEGWCVPTGVKDYEAYRKSYEALPHVFNPVSFDPARWARAAHGAGMRYVVFTTKHHDGFCMWDTQYSDYKITGPDCAFAKDPRADVTKGIFDAFRSQGLWIGAYFSKPDWHSEHFWWPHFPPKSRFPNYDVARYPERWSRFVDYTHSQIMELVSKYGKIDLLWLDGGWVKKAEAVAPHEVPPGYTLEKIPNLDLDLDGLVAKARAVQPTLIVVDRAVPGKYQNYLTPENQIPSRMLPYPWETCMILGGGWSYSPGAQYKPSRELIHLLADIVAKGGNLLLNVGPSPAGTWDDAVYERLERIGAWLDVNGQAIYSTRPQHPYVSGNYRYTRGKDGAVYAILLLADDEHVLPPNLALPGLRLGALSSVELLGNASARVICTADAEGVLTLHLEQSAREIPAGTAALVFRLKTQ